MTNEKSSKSVSENFSSTAKLASNLGFNSQTSVASKDEKRYNPFEHRDVEHPTSTLGALLHLLKSCLGSGILAMPAAFKNAGLAAGSVGTLLAGILCTHTVHLLVRISQKVCIDAKKPSMSFAETCGAAFTYGHPSVRSWGGFIKTLVDYSLVLTYISVLCVYVVFIGASFKEVLDTIYPEHKISIQIYCAITLVPLALVCQIRNLKYLVPCSAAANLMLVVTFGITMYYLFTDIPPPSERNMIVSVTHWPLFLSTVIFAMEGIGVVMPIENQMAKPRQFLGCPGVLNIAMMIVVSLYGIFGFFGYLKFGDDVKGSVTLNLPEDDLIAQLAKILMALSIYFTYALQFYVPMEIIWKKLHVKICEKYHNLVQISLRTVMVSLTVGIAAAFPNLELVISFAGAIFFSTLGLFIPAAIDTVYRWDKSLGKFNYVAWKNITIMIISIIALVSGAYVSIKGMIEDFGGEHIVDDINNILNSTEAYIDT